MRWSPRSGCKTPVGVCWRSSVTRQPKVRGVPYPWALEFDALGVTGSRDEKRWGRKIGQANCGQGNGAHKVLGWTRDPKPFLGTPVSMSMDRRISSSIRSVGLWRRCWINFQKSSRNHSSRSDDDKPSSASELAMPICNPRRRSFSGDNSSKAANPGYKVYHFFGDEGTRRNSHGLH